MLAGMIKRQDETKDHIFIPVDDNPESQIGKVVEINGKQFIKVPQNAYTNYLQQKNAAEIVWAVLHASPKFKSAKQEDVVPKAPWSRTLDKAKFKKGLELAKQKGLMPPREVIENG